jgi:hypothetical protein
VVSRLCLSSAFQLNFQFVFSASSITQKALIQDPHKLLQRVPPLVSPIALLNVTPNPTVTLSLIQLEVLPFTVACITQQCQLLQLMFKLALQWTFTLLRRIVSYHLDDPRSYQHQVHQLLRAVLSNQSLRYFSLVQSSFRRKLLSFFFLM